MKSSWAVRSSSSPRLRGPFHECRRGGVSSWFRSCSESAEDSDSKSLRVDTRRRQVRLRARGVTSRSRTSWIRSPTPVVKLDSSSELNLRRSLVSRGTLFLDSATRGLARISSRRSQISARTDRSIFSMRRWVAFNSRTNCRHDNSWERFGVNSILSTVDSVGNVGIRWNAAPWLRTIEASLASELIAGDGGITGGRENFPICISTERWTGVFNKAANGDPWVSRILGSTRPGLATGA